MGISQRISIKTFLEGGNIISICKAKNHYIYLTYDTKYNKYYIGKRSCNCDIYDDWYYGSGNIIRNIIKKYSKVEIEKRLKKKILCVSNSYEDNIKNEKYYIEKFQADKNPDFYNIATGGYGGNLISGLSDKEKEIIYLKIRKAREGYIASEETKKKISEWGKGRKLTDENKKNISESKKGSKNPFYGKKHTKEELELISQYSKGANNPRARQCVVIDENGIILFQGIRKDVFEWAKENEICCESIVKKRLNDGLPFTPTNITKTSKNAFLYKGIKFQYIENQG